MQQQTLSAIVAWVRLERSLSEFNTSLRKEFGITGFQLAVLRILDGRPALPLAVLRKALVAHPATLGQAVDQLRKQKLCVVTSDPQDKRARLVAITETGQSLLKAVPQAGPVRLWQDDVDPEQLVRFTAALDEAMDIFALTPWSPRGGPQG